MNDSSAQNAIAITAIITNVEVRRILVDNGSSVDVLFYKAYQEMVLRKELIIPHHTPS